MTWLYCRTEDLEPGDCISQSSGSLAESRGSSVYVIVTIDGNLPRSGTIKRADTGAEEARQWYHNTHLMHLVVGGPKLEAARTNLTLIDDQRNWRGAAPEEATTS